MAKKPFSMIAGTGHYLPEKIMANQDYEKILDTTDEWITQMVGIKERHIIDEKGGEITSDLATNAAKLALEDANMNPEDIDAIIVGTVTGDMKFPSTAIFTQRKIGASNAAAFDIAAACSGFLYGLNLADGMIASGRFKNILVIGVEVLTSMVDWSDRSTAVLFGDGAGAAVLVPSDGERGLLGSYVKSDGNLAELLWAPGAGTNIRLSPESIANGDHFIRMEGNQVFKHAVRCMIEATKKAMEEAEVTSEEIDMLIPHQANIRIIDAIAKRVKLEDKLFTNLEYTGNTSAASIPIAIDQARKSGKLKKGDNLLLGAFGAGFTWSGAVIKM